MAAFVEVREDDRIEMDNTDMAIPMRRMVVVQRRVMSADELDALIARLQKARKAMKDRRPTRWSF